MHFQLTEILPRIYHLSMNSPYDLAMHFLRVQEYYESPKFRGRIFTLIDFMEWYSKEQGEGAFTYPSEWVGFNVPSTALLEVYGNPEVIPDFNKYDELMSALAIRIQAIVNQESFYLIGTSEVDSGRTSTINHELAHGLYFTSSAYHKKMQGLLYRTAQGQYDTTLRQAKDILHKMGYHKSVLEDEIQAYFATGPCPELETILTLEIRAPFILAFHAHIEKAKKDWKVKDQELSPSAGLEEVPMERLGI